MKSHFPLKLEKPLVFFDIEATGISPRGDRIVELCLVKVHPDGKRESKTYRINPGMPIPPASTAIHGITDEDIKDSPPFSAIAGNVMKFIEGCDLGGYNILKFDIPMLVEEFARAGVTLNPDDFKVVDVQRVFHIREPRDLSAALAFYCNEMHLDAHGAEADVLATIRVLEGQFKRYSDLPVNVDDMDKLCNPRDPSWADRTGRLKWENGEIVINFGKKKGASLAQVMRDEPGFVRWLLKSDFPRDTQKIVEDAAAGKWPEKPGAVQVEA